LFPVKTLCFRQLKLPRERTQLSEISEYRHPGRLGLNAMSASTAHEIGIVHYPGAQVACILGLTDLFGVASTIALDQRRSSQSSLRVTHWKPIHCSAANLSCVYDSAPRGSPKPRTLIIPPTIVDLPDPDVPAGVVSWVRSRHAAGATLVSLCSGAFILGETGLVGLGYAHDQVLDAGGGGEHV
jgi:transcriptional regulator GlxA family with amidase domain